MIPPPGMVWIPGGKSLIGSDHHYPEERPAHEVEVAGFWMDIHPVTNAQFDIFVEETGHITNAEVAPDQADLPDVPVERLVAGSAVFVAPEGPVDLSHPTWWQYVPDANWRHPNGPGSTIKGLDHHPVVHIDYADALAYANWANKLLPTERQWEHAARGGIQGATYAWGNHIAPAGHRMANYWYGTFPWDNRKPHPPMPTPAGTFPPNGYGLYDMCGSVWEWTSDIWHPRRDIDSQQSNSQQSSTSQVPCCMPPATDTAPDAATDNTAPDNAATVKVTPQAVNHLVVRVIKGGSFLCAENYCTRFRPAARIPQSSETATNHLGLRCIAKA